MWKKIWNSPTVTGWLYFTVVPLRLFLLTPLVLSKLSKEELDAFFLFASTMVLASVVEFRMSDTFDKMLSYAVAGGKELAPFEGLGTSRGVEPNWSLLKRCRQTQRSLTFILLIPVGMFCMFLGWISVGRLLEWNYAKTDIWLGMVMNVAVALLSMLLSPLHSNMKALDKAALGNRLGFFYAAATIILSAIAVALDARLAAIGLIQLLATLVYGMILSYYQPKEIKSSTLVAWSLDREVISWAWRPLLRGVIIQIATFGTARSAGLFLAGNQAPGQLAQFMFAQNLLFTMGNFSATAVLTQIPRYARELVAGHNLTVIRDGTMRVGVSLMMMLGGIMAAAIGAPVLLSLIHSKVAFLDIGTWMLFGVGFTLYTLQNLLALLHDVTNQQVLFARSVCASLLVVCLLFALQHFDLRIPLSAYCVVIFLPYLIVINWIPINKLSELGSVSRWMCCKWILSGGLAYVTQSLSRFAKKSVP